MMNSQVYIESLKQSSTFNVNSNYNVPKENIIFNKKDEVKEEDKKKYFKIVLLNTIIIMITSIENNYETTTIYEMDNGIF